MFNTFYPTLSLKLNKKQKAERKKKAYNFENQKKYLKGLSKPTVIEYHFTSTRLAKINKVNKTSITVNPGPPEQSITAGRV